jgi:hypothetical protein
LIVGLSVDKHGFLVECALGSNEEFAAVVAEEPFILLSGHGTMLRRDVRELKIDYGGTVVVPCAVALCASITTAARRAAPLRRLNSKAAMGRTVVS